MSGGVAKQVMEGSLTLLLLLLLIATQWTFIWYQYFWGGNQKILTMPNIPQVFELTMFFFWQHKEVILDQGEEGKGNEGISIA